MALIIANTYYHKYAPLLHKMTYKSKLILSAAERRGTPVITFKQNYITMHSCLLSSFQLKVNYIII